MTEESAPAPQTPTEPCGNDDCDRCDPRPRWIIRESRVQRITYEREIKAATAAEAMEIFNRGTAWPSSYDERGGEILEQHPPVIRPFTEEHSSRANAMLKHYRDECCYHDLLKSEEAQRLLLSSPGDLASSDDEFSAPDVEPIPES